RTTLDADDVEPWRHARRAVSGRVARPGLAAEVRESEGCVEDAEILTDGRRAERIDDSDRRALTVVPRGVEHRVVVCVRHRGRVEASPCYGRARGLDPRIPVGAD